MPISKLGVHDLLFSGGTTPAEVHYTVPGAQVAGLDICAVGHVGA